MIRVCALDFLNRDSFESDVKLADGKVVVSAGEKITPELILVLYFKEIYVDTPLVDVFPVPTKVEEPEMPSEIPVIDYSAISVESVEVEEAETITEAPKEAELDLNATEENLVAVGAKAPDLSLESAVSNTLSAAPPVEDTLSIDYVEKEPIVQEPVTTKGPELPVLDLEEKAENKEKGPRSADINDVLLESTSDSQKKGASKFDSKVPDAPELDLSVPEKAIPEQDRSPVVPTLDLGEENIIEEKYSLSSSNKKEEPAKVEESPINLLLNFDQSIADEMAENAVMLAKELHYSDSDIKDIKNAALNCNLGIVHFKEEDLKSRDFEKKKAAISYDLAAKKGTLSARVLETIKCHAKPYNTEDFNLNPNIPLGDLIHIIVAYSKLKCLGLSKNEVLRKMLEQGGNEYNVFALHKFLRLMREHE